MHEHPDARSLLSVCAWKMSPCFHRIFQQGVLPLVSKGLSREDGSDLDGTCTACVPYMSVGMNFRGAPVRAFNVKTVE